MHIKILNMELVLGEGPIWYSYRSSWCWLDILKHTLFEIAHDSFPNAKPIKHEFPFIATAMAVVDSSCVLMATDKGIVLYNLTTRDFKIICPLVLADGMRTNEGGMGPDGRFWFSSMEKEPSGFNGGIYSCDTELRLEKHVTGIGIPNTMVWNRIANTFYLSDSYQCKTFAYNVNGSRLCTDTPEVFLDLSENAGSPDGGAIDVEGNLWIAIWGGHAVRCFDPRGRLIHEITLPVPQPSSCCFGGPQGTHLFITSARQSMSEESLVRYPLSGSVFLVEVDVAGMELPDFKLGKET